MGNYRSEFLLGNEYCDRYTSVRRVIYYDAEIRGENFTWKCDEYPLVGEIEQIAPTLYRASFHTCFEEHGSKVGYLHDISGCFGSREEALIAVESKYDPSKDNLRMEPI